MIPNFALLFFIFRNTPFKSRDQGFENQGLKPIIITRYNGWR